MTSERTTPSYHADPWDIAPIAERIWDLKYRLKSADGTPVDQTIDHTWQRVARALASVEAGGKRARTAAEKNFHAAMADFGFLPAGRIIAGAGAKREVTLFNCFVMGRVEDDLSAIFEAVKQAALTMQQGGGIGQDFSTLRPRDALVRSVGAGASGPVSFMDVWDAMCRSIMSAGARRGAMMATLRCDHPDIEEFIAAKSDAGRLRNFNLSVLVTDAFMQAIAADAPWPLVFEGKVYRTLPARQLWEKITRATYDYAEPGVIFIDRINAANNLSYCEEIRATNPCGEQPLPPFGACLLGSINIARFVDRPFEAGAGVDLARLEERVSVAVHMLDNAIDASKYPLEAQQREAIAKRRIGLGMTGLADALIFCGVRYGSPEAVALAGSWMAAIERAAYAASADLAAQKGPFPLYDATKFLARPNIRRLPADVRAAIKRHGIRNGCLTSIAPTGTISLLAGNVSSGIEPVFAFRYRRRLIDEGGAMAQLDVEDYARALHRRRFGADAQLGPAFVTTAELDTHAHIEMQAAVQRHVDSSISKTINCPADMTFEAFSDVYAHAYARGLKGCTTFRPNGVTGAVLTAAEDGRGESPTVAGPASAPATGAGGTIADVTHRDPEAALAPRTHVHAPVPMERGRALAGYTYKLKWPPSDHAIYVTINDVERDGARRPFEIFINTKNLEHYAWTVALTRMISAVFRRGGDVAFVVEELKAVFDPQGGQWLGGRYVPSLLAAIGGIIEMHMIQTGFLRAQDTAGAERIGRLPPDVEVVAAEGSWGAPEGARTQQLAPRPARTASSQAAPAHSNSPLSDRSSAGRIQATLAPGDAAVSGSASTAPRAAPRACPRCHSPSLIREEGCWACLECGYARCG